MVVFCTSRLLTTTGLSHCKGIYATYYATAPCATVMRRRKGIGWLWSLWKRLAALRAGPQWEKGEIKFCVCASHPVLMSPLQLMDHCTVQMTEQVQALITCNTVAHQLFWQTPSEFSEQRPLYIEKMLQKPVHYSKISVLACKHLQHHCACCKCILIESLPWL